MSTQTATPWTRGWRLRWALDHAGLDVQQAAKEIEVSRTTLGRWIHDDEAAPKQVFLRAIADLCGVNYRWLATGDGLPEDEVEAPRPPKPRGGAKIISINSPDDNQDTFSVNRLAAA